MNENKILQTNNILLNVEDINLQHVLPLQFWPANEKWAI